MMLQVMWGAKLPDKFRPYRVANHISPDQATWGIMLLRKRGGRACRENRAPRAIRRINTLFSSVFGCGVE